MKFGLRIVIIKFLHIYSPTTVAFPLLPEYTKYIVVPREHMGEHIQQDGIWGSTEANARY